MRNLIHFCRVDGPGREVSGAGAGLDRKRQFLSTLFLVVTTLASVGAQPAALLGTSAADPAPSTGLGMAMLRLGGALFLVLALFLGAVWVIRRRPWTLNRAARPADLRVIECRPLGGRQALWVIAYRRQRILIGSSPTGLSLLAELPEAAVDEPVVVPTPDFAAAFSALLQRRS